MYIHVKTEEGNWMRGRKRHYPDSTYVLLEAGRGADSLAGS